VRGAEVLATWLASLFDGHLLTFSGSRHVIRLRASGLGGAALLFVHDVSSTPLGGKY
jgi:hypothetical protein